jgi:ankyrin repeat protein
MNHGLLLSEIEHGPIVMGDAGDLFDAALRALNRDDEEGEDDEDEEEDASPRAQLSRLIWQQRPLEDVKALLDEHPDLIKDVSRDEYRRLPLHEAIVTGSDMDVIRYFLKLWPLSVRQRVEGRADDAAGAVNRRNDASNVSSERGLYPLHLALVSSGSAARPHFFRLVKLLVEMWPEALEEPTPRGGLFPIHLALDAGIYPSVAVVRYLFDVCPGTLTGDRDEPVAVTLPLHRKLKRVLTKNPPEHLEVVKFLVGHFPNAIVERDHHGRLPLHYAAQITVPVAITKFLIEQHPAAVHEKENSRGGGLVPLQYGVAYGTTVEHLKLLREAWPESIAAKDDGEEGYAPLHRAIAKRDIQWDVLRYLAETSPGSLRCRSAQGLLPLHVASSSPSLFRSGEDPVKLAQYLVGLCPEAMRERDDLNGELPLHRAIRMDAPLPLVKFLYRRFPESGQETDAEGRPPLHLAVARTESALWTSSFLLRACPEAICVKDRHGRRPLHAAAATRNPDAELLRFLIEIHPEAVRDRDEEGLLPIHHAATSNRLAGPASVLAGPWPESVRALTEWGGTLLACAAAGGNASPDMVRFLAGTWPEAIRIRDQDGFLPLHYAAGQVHVELDVVQVFVILDPEAVQDRGNVHGMLPLHSAAEEDAPLDVVRLLVEQRPESLGERCGYGWLALHYAVARILPKLDIIQFLAEQRPESVHENYPDGRTLLHCAAGNTCTRVEIVRLLVDRVPDSVRQQDADGALPLHHAAKAGDRNPDVVAYLLEQCPQATRVRDAQGRLPIHLAAIHGARLEVVYILLSSWPECLFAGMGKVR